LHISHTHCHFVLFRLVGQVVVGEGRADERVGRERGDAGVVLGEDATAVVDLTFRGGTYAPQVGAGGAAASAGLLLTWPGAASFRGPPPSVMKPAITRAATTAAAIPRASP
jgi:hypothetical protein